MNHGGASATRVVAVLAGSHSFPKFGLLESHCAPLYRALPSPRLPRSGWCHSAASPFKLAISGLRLSAIVYNISMDWIKIEERIPAPVAVLVAYKTAVGKWVRVEVGVAVLQFDGRWTDTDLHDFEGVPLYWMPFPEPPAELKAQERLPGRTES